MSFISSYVTGRRPLNATRPPAFVLALSGLLASVSAFKTFAEFVSPAAFPPPPSSLTDGFSARFHVRFPGTARSSVGAIAGTEIIHDRTPRHPRTTTVAGAAGVAFNVGRAELGLRYVAFAERLGSSRGTLPLSVAWRL